MPSIGLQISWRIQIKTGYNGSLQRLAKETSLSLIQGESSTARERFSALPAFFGPSRALYFGCVNPPTVHQKGRLHLEFAELFHHPSDCRQDDHMWARKPLQSAAEVLAGPRPGWSLIGDPTRRPGGSVRWPIRRRLCTVCRPGALAIRDQGSIGEVNPRVPA